MVQARSLEAEKTTLIVPIAPQADNQPLIGQDITLANATFTDTYPQLDEEPNLEPLSHLEILASIRTPIAVYDPSDKLIFTNPAFDALGESGLKINQRLKLATIPTEEGINITPIEAARREDKITIPPVRFSDNHPLLEVGILPIQRKDGTYVQIEAHDITKLDSVQRDYRQLINFVLGYDHDLKNKLAGAKGFLDLFLRRLPKQISESPLTLLLKASSVLEKAVQMILAFPDQLETTDRLRKEEIDIVALLQELSEGDTVVSFSADRKTRLRVADPEALESVFINLIKNAKEAGADEIRIIYSEFANSIHIQVKDNGKGVPVHKRENIFEKKYGSDTPGGNGIGLYDVVNKLAGHQGTIKFESITAEEFTAKPELGHTGTTFEIILPVEERTSWK